MLLDKKYALPFRVIDALVDHFLRFNKAWGSEDAHHTQLAHSRTAITHTQLSHIAVHNQPTPSVTHLALVPPADEKVE